jgi:Mrp family chromosome partitioning ATPase
MIKTFDAALKRKETVQPRTVARGAPSERRIDAAAFGTRDASGEMEAFFTAVDMPLGRIDGGKIILFTSARAGEGKSTVVGNFAAMLVARQNCSVLVIDAGKDRMLCNRFGVSGPLFSPLVDSSRGELAAVEAGTVTTTVADLGTEACGIMDLMRTAARRERLRQQYDYILIDAPALAAAPSATALSRLTDGVIMVVEAERTRWPVVKHSKEELERAGATVLGVFLNRRRYYIPRVLYDRL